jgi:Amt family ammonium transporter
MGGVIGTISLGIFASAAVNGQSGLIEGNGGFFMKEVVAVLIGAVYAFVFTYLMLAIINLFTKVKVTEEMEDLGLDESLHGERAYDEGAL